MFAAAPAPLPKSCFDKACIARHGCDTLASQRFLKRVSVIQPYIGNRIARLERLWKQ
jgi:hypothetical protein